MKKIVVVGAGTSGWLAASALKRNCPELDITVVYDSSIPTVGVGETLSFAMPGFMRETLGLTDEDWMPQTQATYKSGLNLHDWSERGKITQVRHITDFPAQFLLKSSLENLAQAKFYADTSITDHYTQGGIVDVWCTLFNRGLVGPDMNDLMSSLSESYYFGINNKSIRDVDGQWLINSYTGYSYHYNAENVSNVVGDLVGRPAGVKEIDCRIVEVVVNERTITELKLKDGTTITADLFLDCSGFKRLLVSSLPYQWTDCDEFYNNSAIVKQIPYDEIDHPAHRVTNSTTLVSMDSGWRFSVPLQTRSGNGYVFNSRQSPNIDKLYSEFEDQIKSKNPGVYRHITWNPGYFKHIATGNCIALGLSSGFTDPYDANNLNLTCTMIKDMVTEIKSNPQWYSNMINMVNWKSEKYWDDVDLRVQSSIRLSPRRDTEHYRLMADVAEKTHLRERLINHITNTRKRDVMTSSQHLWPVWSHILVALRNNVTVPDIDVSDNIANLAMKYFEFQKYKYHLKSEMAPTEQQFYEQYKFGK